MKLRTAKKVLSGPSRRAYRMGTVLRAARRAGWRHHRSTANEKIRCHSFVGPMVALKDGGAWTQAAPAIMFVAAGGS